MDNGSGKMAAPRGQVRPLSRQLGLLSSDALRVDTANCAPPEMKRFATMNPFYRDRAWRIPVPGTDRFACSVESIWQGLKLVNGQTDFAMFGDTPVKRPPDAERGLSYDYAASVFAYGDEIVDLVTARLIIYLPAYLYLLEHLVPETTVAEITGWLDQGGNVAFFDWDDNFDILHTGSSFSHSAILADWFGGRLDDLLLLADRISRREVAGLLRLDRYRAWQHSEGR
jgi:hypothetical protein